MNSLHDMIDDWLRKLAARIRMQLNDRHTNVSVDLVFPDRYGPSVRVELYWSTDALGIDIVYQYNVREEYDFSLNRDRDVIVAQACGRFRERLAEWKAKPRHRCGDRA